MAAQRARSSWEIHNGNDLPMELHGDVEVEEFVKSFFGEEVGGVGVAGWANVWCVCVCVCAFVHRAM
jgi:hypothetical protein